MFPRENGEAAHCFGTLLVEWRWTGRFASWKPGQCELVTKRLGNCLCQRRYIYPLPREMRNVADEVSPTTQNTSSCQPESHPRRSKREKRLSIRSRGPNGRRQMWGVSGMAQKNGGVVRLRQTPQVDPAQHTLAAPGWGDSCWLGQPDVVLTGSRIPALFSLK